MDEKFLHRHLGSGPQEELLMLKTLGLSSFQELIDQTIPQSILDRRPIAIAPAKSEKKILEELAHIASQNKIVRSLVGTGYVGCFLPSVIRRNILENPGWYTQYTPYQAEIAQGRLEALINFQTLVADLTGLPIANASLLDESTACAEAMSLSYQARVSQDAHIFLVSSDLHPQNIAVMKTRAEPFGWRVQVEDPGSMKLSSSVFGLLLGYPGSSGAVSWPEGLVAEANQSKILVTVCSDLLALTLYEPPGVMGANIVVGSSQRFGVPMGFGGPHAAFFAVEDALKRRVPGRIIGVSKDSSGKNAYRLALQTREQHIRREKATSNICTAQVLLAIIASMYAVYHGPQGLKAIAKRIRDLTHKLRSRLQSAGIRVCEGEVFDTILLDGVSSQQKKTWIDQALRAGFNLRIDLDGKIGITLDELSSIEEVFSLGEIFGVNSAVKLDETAAAVPHKLVRKKSFLEHPVFNSYHSETEMQRYIRRLESRDLSLTHSMIPLGSCTMKLNAATQMLSIGLPGFSDIHPFAPHSQTKGYQKLIHELERDLCAITGFDAFSLQPNAGSQGEYAGLLAIKKYFESVGQRDRKICLVPESAHGTNPASAAMAGFEIVVVSCDSRGNVDLEDLKAKIATVGKRLGVFMITYPSTHGVFEESIREICSWVHQGGGQVYMDGANFNAQMGLCFPGEFGPDVCHLNLHKTFAIPHGGGGPGMGPIGVKKHLAPFLPSHPFLKRDDVTDVPKAETPVTVSGAPFGSAGVLPISWAFIHLLGPDGLRASAELAILNANYIAKKLHPHFPVLYRGARGFVAHECILDLRPLKAITGIEVEDVAKRLMDYGYHAPTISFPVPGTLMIEPTESESKAELDRFCDAMIHIRQEIAEIETGASHRENNPLKNAPHTIENLVSSEWNFPYSKEKAVFPAPWVRERKFWPHVNRIDGVYGDRNLFCICPPAVKA